MRKLIFSIFFFVASCVMAGVWQTHYAYTQVEQIAVSPTEVYGLSDGSLYSVNKQSEALTLYGFSNGLHATDIACIGYDNLSSTLVILYKNGKVDLLSDRGITYVGDLYLEDMTASKQANTIVFHDGLAYLGMPFGVMTFDMQKREFPNTYYIGAEASEQNVRAIFFDNNSIYAATDSLLFSAPMTANLVDYRNWTEQLLPMSGRLAQLLAEAKSTKVVDGIRVWRAAGDKGIEKRELNQSIYYKPDGPAGNMPYRMRYMADKLYVVPGGRWATQDSRPGWVSYMKNGRWFSANHDYIVGQTGLDAYDFMDAAVYPNDPDKYVVTSYGTGAYLFRDVNLLEHWTIANSGLQAAVPEVDYWYTRTDGVCFDSLGNMWMMNASLSVDHLVIRTPDDVWHNINAYVDGDRVAFETPGEIVISNQAQRYKWLLSCRSKARIVLFDDSGTPTDEADDHSYSRSAWVDQNGLPVEPEYIYCHQQDNHGGLWAGTNDGPLYIPGIREFIEGNACERVRFLQPDGTYLFDGEKINCVEVDDQDRVWIGTQTQGLYVFSADHQQIIYHFMPGDTPMPSACVLSLAFDCSRGIYYIGTGGGILSYREGSTDLQTNPYAPAEIFDESEYSGLMGSWTLHFAYQDVNHIAVTPNLVYGLSEGALFSVDREDEELRYCNHLTGLSDANIASIHYDTQSGLLLVLYNNGNIDLLSDEGDVWNIADLFMKQLSGTSKVANNVYMRDGYAYLAMPFGVMQLNLRKHEIADTYYIGEGGANVDVQYIGILGDSIYAASSSRLYAARIKDNLVDYHVWNVRALPTEGAIVEALRPAPSDTIRVAGETFIAAGENGILRLRQDGTRQNYVPNGPVVNMPYNLDVTNDRLIAVPGGRWAVEFQRLGNVMIYENGTWSNIKQAEIREGLGARGARDFMNVAMDPADRHHFFVTSYGTGLFEFRDDRFYAHYSYYNSPNGLEPAEDGIPLPDWYTRVDGAVFDNQGNVWMMNAGTKPRNVCILAPDGTWHSFNITDRKGVRAPFHTPGHIVIDKNRPNYKWVCSCRLNAGVGLIDDNGTPLNHSDDRTTFYSEFVDQFGTTVKPTNIYCMSQDETGAIWVGTDAGLFTIPANYDFFASNQCQRLKINRNDGSGWADFLLDSEVIKAIAHDGGNRHWIGTADNGVFLIRYKDYDDAATVYHFTTANSPLPSNVIFSLAIMPATGEVFIGTESGLASFRSDASAGHSDYSDAYVYPNPVRPEYEGNITFTGLMTDSYVKVVDAGGNLIYSTRSNGGTAVWNGRNAAGHRASPGVYRAYINTADGGHTVISLLLM